MTSDCRAVLSWLVAISVVAALLRVAPVMLNGVMLHFRDALVAPVEVLVPHLYPSYRGSDECGPTVYAQ